MAPDRDVSEWIISVDDHVVEPPDVWTSRLPRRWREAGPRVVHTDAGDLWQYEDKRLPITGLAAVAGRPPDEWSPEPLRFEDIRPSCYEPAARIADMDTDHVLASLTFPTFPRFCGQTFYEAKDRELALACVRAYNDWMIDEWCGTAPRRLIPLVIIPLWNPQDAAEEIERCAGRGARAISFSENPSMLGLPSIHDADGYWDPVFRAAEETDLALCTHIGSSSRLPQTSEDMPMIVSLSLVAMNAMTTLTDWLYSGNLLRYPNLRLVLSEGGVAWMPFVIERITRDLERQGEWTRRTNYSGQLLDGDFNSGRTGRRAVMVDDPYSFSPLDVFHRQVFGCVLADDYLGDAVERLGSRNIMMETDFPHSDSSWPNSRQLAAEHMKDLSAAARADIRQGNAKRVFRIEPTLA